MLHSLHAINLTEAMDLKQQLRKLFGTAAWSGANTFHYYKNGKKIAL